ncbi:hypothetical protein P4U43_06510 [Arthrobacter sp. EH-1B-1]|uniref:MinD-like ATPase involved in chromosome partitioning or flagellar assembly n=1 Tax=Arthrobacter vasquezii TaxID=2977629 RepID=A0ABT6CTQ2_9MICC|nr:hypothetical protein [Arthrobacter vasquezii]MDF9277444.1 hypothetical protein [Arthrobacter vasquezii]
MSRPVCTATIGDDDTVMVVIDGVERQCDSMPEAITYLADTAKDLGRPLKVTAIDPSSPTNPESFLIVDVDGSVVEDSSVRVKRPSRRGTPHAAQSGASGYSDTPGAGNVAVDVTTADEIPLAEQVTVEESARNEPALAAAETELASLPAAAQAAAAACAAVQVESDDPRMRLRPEIPAEKALTPAREGWRGWSNAAFKTHLAPTGAEQANRDRRSRIQRPLDSHRTVAVVQLKGGATKTTVAYHLAATYGRIRGGNILAGEFNENQGTLGERALAGSHDRTTLDLIRNLGSVTRRTSDLVRYVRPQGDDRIHVLASPPEGADRRRVDGNSVKAAHDVLLSLYSLILLDTGNSAQASTWRAAVDVADSLVFVAQNKADDCRLLEATVEGVKAEGHGDKLARSILVVTNTAQPNAERLAWLKEYGKTIGLAAIAVVPFDRSLQEGMAFNYDILNPATRHAYESATADLTDQL